MSNLPLISVIIPVFNVEDYLEACVNSVISQSYENLEIILVDDGSTDRSAKLCNSLAVKDLRIKTLHKPNGGLSSARNYGIDSATGDYITFVDSDDTITPDAISTLYSLVNQHNTLISMATFNNRCHSRNRIIILPGIDAASRMLYQNDMDSSAWNKLYHSSLFQKHRFTECIYYEDIDFVIRLLPEVDKVVWTDRSLYNYRLRPSSITGNFSLKRLDVLDVTDRIENEAKSKWHSLLPAARDRKLSANFNMFVLLTRNGYAQSKHADRCWHNIKSLRMSSLFNRKVRLKNKLGILASLPGRRFLHLIALTLGKYLS